MSPLAGHRLDAIAHCRRELPTPSIHVLRSVGFDVLSVGESHPGMDDREILALARSLGRWLLTFDSDFAELVFRQRLPPPAAVIAGCFCVVSRTRLRKRPLLAAMPPAGSEP